MNLFENFETSESAVRFALRSLLAFQPVSPKLGPFLLWHSMVICVYHWLPSPHTPAIHEHFLFRRYIYIYNIWKTNMKEVAIAAETAAAASPERTLIVKRINRAEPFKMDSPTIISYNSLIWCNLISTNTHSFPHSLFCKSGIIN